MDNLGNCLLWLGSLTVLYWFDLAGQIFQVHLGQADKLNHVWLGLGVYLAAITAWSIAFVLNFKRKE